MIAILVVSLSTKGHHLGISADEQLLNVSRNLADHMTREQRMTKN